VRAAAAVDGIEKAVMAAKTTQSFQIIPAPPLGAVVQMPA
jgi:hypothetical protein